MVVNQSQPSPYLTEINDWRQARDESLRAEDGWLALIGLFWLHEGTNTVGSNPRADIPIDAQNIPDHIGTIEFHDGQATLHVTTDVHDVPVTVDGVPTRQAVLRDDSQKDAASLVKVGSVTFFVIRRGDEYAVRVRDANNPARLAFTGRKWFPVDEQYRVVGQFIAHDRPRSIPIANSAGQTVQQSNPGRVEFTLNGQALALEAFAAGAGELWFVFRDATSGQSTYGAGRYLYAPISESGEVHLDFNKAYHPPCAYTPYATCARPPKENLLPL
ncbi:MAG: DUF1684 domain-containing protein, partial [Anaerolineae bacterium]|nr:DUF1684 domain-containing protein [Anaerolineae bacterium]